MSGEKRRLRSAVGRARLRVQCDGEGWIEVDLQVRRVNRIDVEEGGTIRSDPIRWGSGHGRAVAGRRPKKKKEKKKGTCQNRGTQQSQQLSTRTNVHLKHTNGSRQTLRQAPITTQGGNEPQKFHLC